MPSDRIRNFCIIAHIDHGKSTLADRLLELTGTVDKRLMQNQMLDQMDIERERGITVKLAPVRMVWQGYELNLIDTPGHVDFAYEVSRSLAAVEGAILLVDAGQGIQAQTLANFDLAKRQKLAIIPVINKIDLPHVDVDTITAELTKLLDVRPDDILKVSAKSGLNTEEILNRVISNVPPPRGESNGPLRALIFDSVFDSYQGVVIYVRLIDGSIKAGEQLYLVASRAHTTVLEVGVFKPQREPSDLLQAGEIGYIVTGFKDVRQARVGDTATTDLDQAKALPGYQQMKPMVFAGIYLSSGDAPKLRVAIDKLKLNDASLVSEPEQSPALGSGFRCGFLGLLHLDIIRERLIREYGLDVIVTVPSVAYHVYRDHHLTPLIVHSPIDLPDPSVISRVEEPIMNLQVVTPTTYIGAVMTATQEKRGVFNRLEYIDDQRAILFFSIPLASILVDYYDTLKSVTSGYASVNYEFSGYQPAEVVRLDIMVAGEPVEPLATIVYRDSLYRVARVIVEKLKDILPRQMFEVKIQATVGAKVIAAERIPPMRKDVTAKLYGGDVTRKRKLLEKQKKGKKRMKSFGKVDIPSDAYLAVLKR